MAQLTLETTMQTSFRDIGDISSDKAFGDYNRRIGYLAEHGRLQEEDIRELINPDRDVSDVIDHAAKAALSEMISVEALYLPGYTAVVVHGNGSIMGMQEKPNDIPKLQSYGPSLMWAMRKVGHEKLATERARSSASVQPGYEIVSDVLTGKNMVDIHYGDRHHVGGATLQNFVNPQSSSMRRFEYEIVHAGVSGVVATDRFRDIASVRPKTTFIAAEAYADSAMLDGFHGNMFAGSLDSTLGALILANIAGHELEDYFSFTDHAIDAITERHDNGINVH